MCFLIKTLRSTWIWVFDFDFPKISFCLLIEVLTPQPFLKKGTLAFHGWSFFDCVTQISFTFWYSLWQFVYLFVRSWFSFINIMYVDCFLHIDPLPFLRMLSHYFYWVKILNSFTVNIRFFSSSWILRMKYVFNWVLEYTFYILVFYKSFFIFKVLNPDRLLRNCTVCRRRTC